jgi:tetratricopeptide (TPR) repeat protein
MDHLGKGESEDFLAGRLEASDRRRVILHLLGGCSWCRSQMKSLAAPLLGEELWAAAKPVAEESYDEALSRAAAAAKSFLGRWRKERAKLQRALSLLEQFPTGLKDKNFPARQAQALHGWPLCEALLRKSYEARFSDPKRMLNLAEDAAGVAKHARPEKYPWPGFLSDLRARAFAELGNAYRINDRLSEADAAFKRARNYLEEGTGDFFLHARVLDLEASLRRAQRRLEDAIALLDQVYGLYLEAGDLHLAGRALISKSISTHYRGCPREAVGLCEEGLRFLEPGRDPHLITVSQQVLLDALTDSGEYRKASRLLLQSGFRKAFEGEPLNLLKLRWMEGRIHAGLGRQAQAERAFCEARREFVRRGQVYDAAMVGLDLAALWLRQGQAVQVQELAEEMYATFKHLGVPLEAAKALQFFH